MADEVGKVSLGIELDEGGLGKQIGAIAKGMGARFSSVLKGSMQSVMKGAKASTMTMPAPKIDVEAAKAEIDQLTAVLDNTNAKLDIQQRKLAELKQSYEGTFNEAKKNKIQEKIVNTEAAILRLTKTSDQTSAKIWKLEDSLESASQAAAQAEKPVAEVEQKLKQTNKTLGVSGKQFKAAAKGAGVMGTAFAAAGKRAGKMGNQFTSAFRQIAKQVLVFAVLYRAIRGLQSYIGSSLATNDEYVKSLEQVKMNLKTAFAPIFQAALPAINALIKAMVTATTYIAAFTSALFGKTYKQSYQAAKGIDAARKSMDAYGKSAKKAAGSTASFDELNLLDNSTGDDGGFAADLAAYEMPDLDVDSIQTQMDDLAFGIRSTFDWAWQGIQSGWRWATSTFGPGLQQAWATVQPELGLWKEQFGLMFADIASLGEPLKNWWTNNLVPAWQNGVAVGSGVVAGLSETFRTVFNDIWNAAFPVIEKFVVEGLPRITEFVEESQKLFGEMFNVVKQIFDDLWSAAVQPGMDLVSQIIQDTLDIIFGWWDTWGKDILQGLGTTLGGIRELWSSLFDGYLKPAAKSILGFLTKLWNDHLRDLVEEIGKFIGILITAAQDILNKFILPIVNWLVQKLGPIFAETFDGVIRVMGEALGGAIDAAAGIIKALGGIIEFIAGVFTGDWKRAWNGIVTFMDGIGKSITGIFKGVVNSIIEAFNGMIRRLNKVKVDIPDWAAQLTGFSSFGINIPTIPKLAKGGLVTGPTLAMVGDNPGANVDPEVVSPLSKLQEMLTGSNGEVVSVLMMMLEVLREIAAKDPTVRIGETELGRATADALENIRRRSGRNAVTV